MVRDPHWCGIFTGAASSLVQVGQKLLDGGVYWFGMSEIRGVGCAFDRDQ